MNDPYGQSPTRQWGQLDDDFRPPYTQDPPITAPYPQYAQQAYPPPPQPAGPAGQPIYVPVPVKSDPSDGLALTSMILGIIAAALGFIPVIGICLALAPAIVGIVLGALGLRSEKRRGMAIAGIILSVVGLFAGTVIFWI